MRGYALQRRDRMDEILAQLGSFADFFGLVLGLNASKNPHTLELISTVQALAGAATMLPKHMLACRRPDEIDSRILPIIPTPGHGSHPSGHATQAFAIASVLSAIVKSSSKHFLDGTDRIELLWKMAHRIAVNRTVAGVHFPMDSAAGAMLGIVLGQVIVAMATPMTKVTGGTFNASNTDDFLFSSIKKSFDDPWAIPNVEKLKKAATVNNDPALTWLWGKAIAEFSVPHKAA
jgi:PAP2 superfamily